MPDTMKALLLDRPGPPQSLKIGEAPVPEPGRGEIRVQVKAAALNPVDYKVASSGVSGWEYPFILGLDVAGIVDAVGPGVAVWAPGDRVVYHGDLTKPGGYAEFAVTTAHTTAAIPADVSYVDAAAVACAGMTAYQAMDRKLPLDHLRTVLIHAGAGGVGGYGLQLARNVGLEAITTCSPRNNDWVQELGAAHVIDYNREDVVERVLELTDGRGVDASINTIGPESAAQDLKALAFNGHLVCVSGAPDPTRTSYFTEARSVHRIYLGRVHQTDDEAGQRDLARMCQELVAMVRDGIIEPMVTDVISLEDVPEGLERLAGRHVRGKIVIEL